MGNPYKIVTLIWYTSGETDAHLQLNLLLIFSNDLKTKKPLQTKKAKLIIINLLIV